MSSLTAGMLMTKDANGPFKYGFKNPAKPPSFSESCESNDPMVMASVRLFETGLCLPYVDPGVGKAWATLLLRARVRATPVCRLELAAASFTRSKLFAFVSATLFVRLVDAMRRPGLPRATSRRCGSPKQLAHPGSALGGGLSRPRDRDRCRTTAQFDADVGRRGLGGELHRDEGRRCLRQLTIRCR